MAGYSIDVEALRAGVARNMEEQRPLAVFFCVQHTHMMQAWVRTTGAYVDTAVWPLAARAA